MTDLVAPGHVYQPDLGTGIEWVEGVATLWDRGVKIAEAPHDTKSPYEFFYGLVFGDAFPQVTHWWFRSAWTQRVRVSGPQGQLDSDTAYGYIQFIDEEQDGEVWTVSTLGGVADVDVPMPPLETQAVNLPLRVTLGNLVLKTITGEKKSDQWQFATSLVERGVLAQAFPTGVNGMGWQMHNVHMPLRNALCHLQGLSAPN